MSEQQPIQVISKRRARIAQQREVAAALEAHLQAKHPGKFRVMVLGERLSIRKQ